MRTIAAGVIAFALTLDVINAEIIDRVAVSIEREVITDSEIQRDIRVTAFLNGEQPNFSADAKRSTADRLVEQAIVRREIETSRYVLPAGNAASLYDKFKKSHYPDPEAYRNALAKYGITDEDVRGAFQWQTRLLEFIDARFRPGVQVAESEIRDYYEHEYVPEAKSKGQQPASYDDAHQAIEDVLLNRLLDNAVDRWLGQTRTQLDIRYHPEAFR